jgi:small subunit ribosomal protein S25e
MGGSKKKSMKQIERAQTSKEPKEKEVKKSKSPVVEKKFGGINAPDVANPDFISELGKMKAITPYAVASRYGLRLSIAKDFLEDLSHRGVIQYVGGHARLRIYRLIAAT